MAQEVPKYRPQVGERSMNTITQDRHRSMLDVRQVHSWIEAMERKKIPLPPSGIFLDIGTGSGAGPLGFATRFNGDEYADSKFVGVDLLGPASGQVEVPDELASKIEYVWNTDGFEYLKALPDASVSFLLFVNVGEVIGIEAANADKSIDYYDDTNLAFVAYEAGRLIKPGGILYISTGLSENGVTVFNQYSGNTFESLFGKYRFHNAGDEKHRFFRKL